MLGALPLVIGETQLPLVLTFSYGETHAPASGTLFATTVTVLRNRQEQLRATINKEAAELRLLRRAVFGMWGTPSHAGRRHSALSLLHGYNRQLITENVRTLRPLSPCTQKKTASPHQLQPLIENN